MGLLHLFLYIIYILYKYWCTLREDDPHGIETCRSSNSLTVKNLYCNTAHLLVFGGALIHKYQPGINLNMHWSGYSLEYNGYVVKKFPEFIKLKKLFSWLQKARHWNLSWTWRLQPTQLHASFWRSALILPSTISFLQVAGEDILQAVGLTRQLRPTNFVHLTFRHRASSI